VNFSISSVLLIALLLLLLLLSFSKNQTSRTETKKQTTIVFVYRTHIITNIIYKTDTAVGANPASKNNNT